MTSTITFAPSTHPTDPEPTPPAPSRRVRDRPVPSDRLADRHLSTDRTPDGRSPADCGSDGRGSTGRVTSARTPVDPTTIDPTPFDPMSSRVTDRLRAEWARLAVRPSAVRRARSWYVTTSPFTDLHRLLALAGYRTAETEATEAVLAALVVRARTDELAARIVLQRILPALISAGRRYGSRAQRAHLDPVEEIVAAAWIAIRSYDPGRPPSNLAAALVGAAAYRAFRAPIRRRAATELPIDAVSLSDPSPVGLPLIRIDLAPTSASTSAAVPADEVTSDGGDARVELLALLREAVRRGAVLEEDLRFVRAYLQHGSSVDAAAALGVTTRTMRNHRDRFSHRMRRVALAA
jgi:DNA-directed RNA polymerase specialized sigma24 family protein